MVMVAQKTASIKSLLLRAWRERWSDMQWSVCIKHHIQTDSPEQAQQLADMMLQQALVGSTPNMLILSYFKHTICSKIISVTAAIQAIVKFTDISKPYCIKSLLEVMEIFAHPLSYHGLSDDSISLCQSTLALLRWLLELISKFIHKVSSNKLQAEYSTLLERAVDVTEKVLASQQNTALIYIASLEYPALYSAMEEAKGKVQKVLSHCQLDKPVQSRVVDCLDKMSVITEFNIGGHANIDVSYHSLNISINIVTGIEAVLNPTNDIPLLVEQFLEIERAQGLSRPGLYCELLRTCVMGMADAAGGTDELKWASFTYLKLPNILIALVKQRPEKVANDELQQGLNKLLDFVSLLDVTDSKCHCDSVSFLMHEFYSKHNLITEETYQEIRNRRHRETQRQACQEQSNLQPSACLILRAEPTLYSILKTLDTDYSKNQEPLRGVLSQMMSGKSLELILAAAAARGKVQSFAMKIVKFNELSKHATGESSNAAQTRATIFDISFLMLCHISQLYGLQMITSCPEGSSSFFAQWAVCCLPESGHYKPLDMLSSLCDNNKIDGLLHQINPGGELRLSLTRWHDVCLNIPSALQEVLYAWEHGAIKQETVQQIIDNLKLRMCCLPVVVAAWLCSFIKISDEQARQKPLQILRWLTSPTSSDPSTKSNLMLTIIRHMVQELVPQSTGLALRTQPYSLPNHTPILRVLSDKLKEIFTHGSIDIQSIHQMAYLLNIGGTLWFCENTVKEVLTYDRVEDINQGICMAYALFHLDIEALTLDLIHHVVPQLLQISEKYLHNIVDPRGKALARLSVMCLSVCYKVKTLSEKEGTSPTKRGKKRSRAELELEEPSDSCEETQAQKLRRLSSVCDDLLPPNFGSDAFTVPSLMTSKDDVEMEPSYDTTDTLNKALVNLFRLFHTILCQKSVSPRTEFVSSFILETLKCNSHVARFILQFMPAAMVSQLLKYLDHSLTPDLILHMCDLTTPAGRNVAAKAICQHAHSVYTRAKQTK